MSVVNPYAPPIARLSMSGVWEARPDEREKSVVPSPAKFADS
jgi:hypothetical protein